jgi:hypothetical protein
MGGDWAHCFILYLSSFLITALGSWAVRVIMSWAILKWDTPNWIYQFSAEVPKMVVENRVTPPMVEATTSQG